MKYWKPTVFLTALLFLFLAGSSLTPTKTYAATKNSYQFDFGGKGAAKGYTGVSASDAYSKKKGYGFRETKNMANVKAAGKGALSDAVQFKSSKTTNTFNVDLPKGMYEITVYLGNDTRTGQ